MNVAPTTITLRLFVQSLSTELESRGYSSEFLVNSKIDPASQPPGVFHFNLYRGYFFWLSWVSNLRTLTLLFLHRPDIVHVHTPAGALGMLPFLPLLRRRGIRLVYTARGGFNEGVALPWRIAWGFVDPLRWVFWDALGVINEKMFEQTKRSRRGIPVKLLSTGGATPNVEIAHRGNPGASEMVLPGAHGIRLAWVGRLSRDKRPGDFLKLIRQLREDHALEVEGVLIGAADKVDRVRLDSSHSAIHRTGWVEVPQTYLGSCDFFISTSVREGYGLVPLEAGLVGTPTIGYRTMGTSKSIPEAGGILVPAKDLDAIAREVVAWAKLPLSEQQSFRRDVERKSHETWSNSRLSDELDQLYREALR